MHFFIFLFAGLIVKQSQSRPGKNLPDTVEVEEKEIHQINQGRDLNLFEGDILQSQTRSAISDNQYRWKTPVPYILDAGLDINAKGVILRAFDQYALKSCIDFKLKDTEKNYISFEKDAGCFSYVGNVPGRTGQPLSIGQNCDSIAIVEHELLHALGFWHEQSRYDRDDHVTVVWENIIEGRAHNFIKEFRNETTTQGTPYDYDSVMHYSKLAFSNGNGSTIITKLPQFQYRIGQRFDMSHYDAVELNSLYNCTSSVALLERCSFENGTCQMSRCSRSNLTWSSESSTPGGPNSGHTGLGVSAGPTSSPSNETSTSAPDNQTDIFMHFSTANGVEGDRAKMETRRLTLRRSCTVQCLQFYYYHSGNESDQLNIWIREFYDELDSGKLRLMWQITGPPADYWQLQHVLLNATKTFQVEFEGRKGEGSSIGGFSIDDINLSETECPHQTWQIRNVEKLRAFSSVIFSPRYFSRDGYGYQIFARFNPGSSDVYVRLVSGENDDQLLWPCPWRQITIVMLDQNPDIQQRMSRQLSFTTDPTSQHSHVWDNPRIVGTLFNDSFNESYYVNLGFGSRNFRTVEDGRDGAFIKGGDIFILVSMQDISQLRFENSLACNTMLPPRNFSSDRMDDGPCVAPPTPEPEPEPSSSMRVTASVMGILVGWSLLWSH